MDHIEAGLNKNKTKKPILGPCDDIVFEQVQALRTAGTSVNATVLAGLICATLTKHAPWQLKSKGGAVDPHSPSLHQSFRMRHNLVMRRRTSTRKQMSERQKAKKIRAFKRKVDKLAKKYNMPDALIINFDETNVPVIPKSGYTLEVRGSRSVRIVGADDKRNITAIPAGARDGTKLPWQVSPSSPSPSRPRSRI